MLQRPQEVVVRSRIALGYTGPEIADRLVMALDTVRAYIRNIKRKRGARTLPHLVALALSARQK